MQSLVKLRENRGLTQTKLANMIGVRPNTVSQYEAGKREPNLEILKKLVNVLDCTYDELLA